MQWLLDEGRFILWLLAAAAQVFLVLAVRLRLLRRFGGGRSVQYGVAAGAQFLLLLRQFNLQRCSRWRRGC